MYRSTEVYDDYVIRVAVTTYHAQYSVLAESHRIFEMVRVDQYGQFRTAPFDFDFKENKNDMSNKKLASILTI